MALNWTVKRICAEMGLGRSQYYARYKLLEDRIKNDQPIETGHLEIVNTSNAEKLFSRIYKNGFALSDKYRANGQDEKAFEHDKSMADIAVKEAKCIQIYSSVNTQQGENYQDKEANWNAAIQAFIIDCHDGMSEESRKYLDAKYKAGPPTEN